MTYQVLGKWPETLWKQRKLSAELSDEYLFLMRDGVLARKRNLEAVREHEEAAAERALIEANTARLRSQSCTSPGWPLSKRTAFGTLCWWLWVPHILGIRKYAARVEFATTTGGTCAYSRYLFAVPIAITANHSTRNLDFLHTHDWLKHTSNRVFVQFPDILGRV